jgi:hypothetical protein
VAGPMVDDIAVQSEEERGEMRYDAIQSLEWPSWKLGWCQCDWEVTTGLTEGLSCPEKDR